MAVLTGKTAFDNFFGKGAKERRKKRKATRDKKRELRLRKKEAKTQIVEQKAQERGLDNQSKQVQIQTTSQLASQEVMQPQPQQMPQSQMNRNRNMWIVGGVVGVILIGLLIFFMTKD